MAVLAILLEDEPAPLSATVVRSLADLGVSRLELLGDNGAFAVVMEGWALSPRAAAAAVLELLGDPPGARVLHTLARVAVNAAT